MTILVDADSIYFRAACLAENPSVMRQMIDSKMNEIEQQCWDDKFLIAVKGRGNFRHNLYPQYKSQRPELAEHLINMRDYGRKYFIDEHGAVEAHGMEADDLVAIWAKDCHDFGVDYTVVGVDKDLLQIPGNHYNFVKKEHCVIDEDIANYKLMLQCITGDTADNIAGLKGIGPKRGSALLEGAKIDRRWKLVKKAWVDHKAGDPFVTWRLLTMIRSHAEHKAIIDHIYSEPDRHETIAFLKSFCDNGRWNDEMNGDDIDSVVKLNKIKEDNRKYRETYSLF